METLEQPTIHNHEKVRQAREAFKSERKRAMIAIGGMSDFKERSKAIKEVMGKKFSYSLK